MEPSYKTIADLFAVAQPSEAELLETAEERTTKEGRDAQESEALGRKSLTDGDFEAAVKHFQRAVSQRDPNDISARIDLAGAYDYGDQYPQAYRQYETAIRLQKDALEPRLGMSDLYKKYGRFRDAIVTLEEAIEKEPTNAYLRIKLAETLRDAGYPKKAYEAAQYAVMAQPENAFNHYWVGDILITLGRYEEALDSLQAAIELSPGDDHLYVRASVAFWCSNRMQEAVKAIRLASDLDPSKDWYHGVLEILLREMRLVEEADLEIDRARKMDRYDRELLRRLLDEMKIDSSFIDVD